MHTLPWSSPGKGQIVVVKGSLPRQRMRCSSPNRGAAAAAAVAAVVEGAVVVAVGGVPPILLISQGVRRHGQIWNVAALFLDFDVLYVSDGIGNHPCQELNRHSQKQFCTQIDAGPC